MSQCIQYNDIHLFSVYILFRHNQQFLDDTHQDGYCNIILFVLVSLITRRGKTQFGVRGLWDTALSVHAAQVQLFHVLCLNALKSLECLNLQGLKTCANDKLLWRHTVVAHELSSAPFWAGLG